MKPQKGICLSSWVRLLALSLLLGFGLVTGTLLASRTAHAQAAATVTITDCTDDTQLRSAIANAASGDTIAFGCSGTIPITVANGPLTIATNLTLDGNGQNVTLDGGNSVQVLHVNSSITFMLNVLTVANGKVTATGASSDSGGGLTADPGSKVSISNSTFANNSSSATGAGGDSEGGGLVNNTIKKGHKGNGLATRNLYRSPLINYVG